jgi:hypothetical protein
VKISKELKAIRATAISLLIAHNAYTAPPFAQKKTAAQITADYESTLKGEPTQSSPSLIKSPFKGTDEDAFLVHGRNVTENAKGTGAGIDLVTAANFNATERKSHQAV